MAIVRLGGGGGGGAVLPVRKAVPNVIEILTCLASCLFVETKGFHPKLAIL